MPDMEAARKALETAAVRLSRDLGETQELAEANAKVSTALTEQQHHLRTGAVDKAEVNPDSQTERRFDCTVEDAKERPQIAMNAATQRFAAPSQRHRRRPIV